MDEFKNAKITDVYVFYCDTGYAAHECELERTLAEILGYATQEELDNLINTDEPEVALNYINDCFEQEYTDFMQNINSGWYKKEES